MAVPVRPQRPLHHSKLHQLGCGTYDVFLLERGGQRPVGKLEQTSVTWSRSLDATSQASVSIDGVASEEQGRRNLKACARILRQARPWEHEVGVYRNGQRIWRGPLTVAEYPPMQAQLTAADLTAWWARRWLTEDFDFSVVQADMGGLFALVVANLLAQDNSFGMVVDGGVSAGLANRSYLAADYLMGDTVIRDLASAGVDYTCLSSTLYLGGPTVPITPRSWGARPVPVLLASHFAQPPTIRLDGTSQATAIVVRGAGGVVGSAGGLSEQFGLLGRVVSNELALDAASCAAQAATILAESRSAGIYQALAVITGGTLRPEAPIAAEELVPGSRVDVRIDHPCFPVLGQYRLGTVDVSSSGANEESVAVTFIPLGTTTAAEPQ